MKVIKNSKNFCILIDGEYSIKESECKYIFKKIKKYLINVFTYCTITI